MVFSCKNACGKLTTKMAEPGNVLPWGAIYHKKMTLNKPLARQNGMQQAEWVKP